jgi:hypothetical protein
LGFPFVFCLNRICMGGFAAYPTADCFFYLMLATLLGRVIRLLSFVMVQPHS